MHVESTHTPLFKQSGLSARPKSSEYLHILILWRQRAVN